MKAPAFQWYAAEYLADERVAQLTLEAEAVYVRLLSYCWREGSIPANPVQCAPLCKYADVKVIKPALALFMKSPSQPGRLIHKRLEEERGKQEAFRAKQAENGRNGGRPRKAKPNPDESQTKGLGYSGETQTKAKKSSSSSTSSAITSDDVAPPSEEPSFKADPKPKLVAMALTDPADEQLWSASPLTKPNAFKAICDRLGFLEIDYELYRKQALVAAENGNISRTIKQWESWIRNYLNNQMKNGPLLKYTPPSLSEPTPRHLLPPPGREMPGQPLVFQGERDAFVNKMLLQNRQREYPNAQIHILTPR